MKTLPVQGESEETSVPFNHVYQCESCRDTGELSDGGDDSRVCHCIKEAKMERDADDAWKEKDSI